MLVRLRAVLRRRPFSSLSSIALVLAMAGFASPASASEREVVASGNGGSVVEHARAVSLLRMAGRPVRLSGRCASACTLHLSLPGEQLCMEPDAELIFHAAHGGEADMNAWATRYMYDRYPAWVRDWIDARGGLSDRLLTMRASDMAGHIPPCDLARASETR